MTWTWLGVVSGSASKMRPTNTAFIRRQLEVHPELRTLYAKGLVWGFAHLTFDHSEMRVEISRMVAEGDLVDCHFALLCKHTADFGDLKAKGNALRIPAISTFRVANGKLAEGWELFDSGDMARQMQA